VGNKAAGRTVIFMEVSWTVDLFLCIVGVRGVKVGRMKSDTMIIKKLKFFKEN
jgi:hypothetical protein